MAERVTTTLLCDLHLAQDIEVTEEVATVPPVAVNGDKPRTLDLCKDCRTEWYEPFVEGLQAHGRVTTKNKRAKAKPTPAPTTPEPRRIDLGSNICPDCSRTFNTAQGLNNHWTRTHAPKHGQTPTPAEDTTTTQDTHECPTCGKTFAKHQGLNLHRVRAHGYRKGDAA